MTTEEFLAITRERYGSRGVRQAKTWLANLEETKPPIPDDEMPAFRTLMMEMWLDSKEEAKKYTP